MSEFEEKVIIDAITRMLARREHSIDEIKRKLQAKGIPDEAFLPVLNQFVEARVQSNERYAESRARSLANKGSGPAKIRADLMQRGVSERDIESAFEDLEVDWYALACEVRIKKFGRALPQTYEKRVRQMQFLQYRGFEMSHINYAVSGD
ncbi:regulatory protein RecX [Alteromonas sp. CYL-A6]|uniref:regulatory protein RecX n=1 Tax=Alteromonas nitratireducens TaxID=3390813 RepID=UPI0034C0ABA9